VELYDFGPRRVSHSQREKGMISEINLTASNLLGRERKSLANKPFYDLIKPEFQDAFLFSQTGGPQVFRDPIVRACAQRRMVGPSFMPNWKHRGGERRATDNTDPSSPTLPSASGIEDELGRYQLLARHGRDIILFLRGADGGIVESK